MKRRFAQLIVTAALIGPVVSIGHEAVAQDIDKKARRQMKQERKMEKDLARNDRWIAKLEARMIERRQKELKSATPLSARGSEVKFYHDGKYITLGYFDRSNVFRAYDKTSEPVTETGGIAPQK